MSWICIFLVGFFTALVALFIDSIIRILTDTKLNTVTAMMTSCEDKSCVASSLFSLVGFNMAFVLVACLLVVYGEPLAAGSGIPEIKCYLNGVKVRNVTRMKTLVCKAVGVLFSVSGGLLVGKEGPMIHSGGVIGAGIPQFQFISLFKYRIPMLSYFRSDRDKRDFVSAGAASGVAAAFGAPIGGVLFSLEEGCSFWNQKLTWKTLFCTMTSTFTLNFFLSGIREGTWGYFDQSGLLTFGVFECESSDESCHLWTAYHLFIFILIGFGGGIFGFIFNWLNTKLTVWRLNYLSKKPKYYKILEALSVALMTSLIAYLIPLWVGECSVIKRSNSTQESGSLYQRFLCEPGEYNDMATLFYNPQEDAIKMLFHGDAEQFSLVTLGTFFMFFFLLSCWTYGSSVPSGLFVPCILCGAAYGRFIANILYTQLGMTDIYLGTFSLIGAAAFLGGVVRMTISLTVILIECTNEISLSLPIMVTLMVAKWVGDMVNNGLYDIHVELKNVPLLEWESPTECASLTAGDIMSTDIKYLLPHTRWRYAADLLRTTAHHSFPVVTIANDDHLREITESDEKLNENIKYRHKSYTGRKDFIENQPKIGEMNPNFQQTENRLNVNGSIDENILSYEPRAQQANMTLHGMILRSQLTTLLKQNVSYEENEGPSNQSKPSYEQCNELYPNFPDAHELRGEIDAMGGHLVDVTSHMHPCPYTVHPCSPLPPVFNLFRTMGLRHLPVVNKRGEILGIITRHDLMHHKLSVINKKVNTRT